MLNLLPVGDGKIIKRNKFGFYVKLNNENPIFIHYSDTLNESIFNDIEDEEMIEFKSADSFDSVFINPQEYAVVKRFQKDRSMGEYSTIIMKNNEHINVVGLPSIVAKKIREYRKSKDQTE